MVAKKPHSASVRVRSKADGTTAYDVRFRHEGQSRSVAFLDHRAAENWARVLRKVGPVDALAFLDIRSADGVPTVDEWAETYITGKSGVEGKTLEHYRMYMRLHISPTFGHLPVDAVSADAVALWINEAHARGVSSKTIKNWHGFMSGMFARAVDDELIRRNPCARSRMPESESTEMVFLSPNEFTTLLGYIPKIYQPLVLLLAATGLRWGEATALKPSDFDLEARTVRVSRAWKSSAGRGWYLGPPKTKRSKRTVTLPDNLVPLLRPLMGNEFVFTNTRGKPIRQNNFLEHAWNPARRLANGLPAFAQGANPDRPWAARSRSTWAGRVPAAVPLGKVPRVHDLRHSHVSWLLAEGVGVDVVARRLGHESIQTTVDRYGHIASERLAAAGVRIGFVLAGAMPEIES